MILIIGGAYQGKLDFALEKYDLTDGDVFSCGEGDINFGKKCICRIEEYVWNHPDALAYFREHRAEWENSILICRDLSCGVVPLERENRVWRQSTGKLCQYLAGEAKEVYRIFCGLEQRLK